MRALRMVCLWLILAFFTRSSGYVLQVQLTWQRVGAMPLYINSDNWRLYNGPCGTNTYDFLLNPKCGDPTAGLQANPGGWPRSTYLRVVLNLVMDQAVCASSGCAVGPYLSLSGLSGGAAWATLDFDQNAGFVWCTNPPCADNPSCSPTTVWNEAKQVIISNPSASGSCTSGSCMVVMKTVNKMVYAQYSTFVYYSPCVPTGNATVSFSLNAPFFTPATDSSPVAPAIYEYQRCNLFVSNVATTSTSLPSKGYCTCVENCCQTQTAPCLTYVIPGATSKFSLISGITLSIPFSTDSGKTTQGISPRTNLNSPRCSIPPIVSIPYLGTGQNITFSVVAVDEDGSTVPSFILNGPSTPYASVSNSGIMFTALPVKILGVTMQYVADFEIFPMRITVVDPVVQVGSGNSSTSFVQFWVKSCKQGGPVPIDQLSDGLQVRYALGDSTPVFVVQGRCLSSNSMVQMFNSSIQDANGCRNAGGQWDSTWMTRAKRSFSCPVGQTCNILLTAVKFNFSSTPTGRCLWSDSRPLPNIPNCSSILAQAVSVTIDTTQAEITGEHTTSLENSLSNPTSVNIGIFAARSGANSMPYDFDSGRKEILCFQAQSNDTLSLTGQCWSIPYCVTVIIQGTIPQIVSPTISSTCLQRNLANFSQYVHGECPDLYACWPSNSFSDFPINAVEQSQFETVNVIIDNITTLNYYSSDYFVGGLNFQSEIAGIAGSQACLSNIYDPYSSTAGLTFATSFGSVCANGIVRISFNLDYTSTGHSPLKTATNSDGHDVPMFNGDKMLCYTISDNQATVWGRGLSNKLSKCHIVRLRGAPVFVGSSSNPLDSPFLSISSSGLWINERTLLAYVGTNLAFTFRAYDPNLEDAISISFLEDPGIPNEAIYSQQICIDQGNFSNVQSDGIFRTEKLCINPDGSTSTCTTFASPCAEAYRNFSWMPTPGQEGRSYKICAVVKDDSSYCAVNHTRRNAQLYRPCCPLCASSQDNAYCSFLASLTGTSEQSTVNGFYSPPFCVIVDVQRPQAAWDPESVPTEAGVVKIAHVGCKVSWKVAASDQNYTMLIVVKDQTQMPPGSTFDTISSGKFTHMEFRWTPQRGMEGSSYTVCFLAYATVTYTSFLSKTNLTGNLAMADGVFSLPERCMTIQVGRCKYCPGKDQSLQTLMKELSTDMNWLRLWASNGNDDGDSLTLPIEDPTLLATGNQDGEFNIQLLNLGPVYRIGPGESLASVASQFRTTVKSLLSLNPDVQDPTTLESGQDLCLIPCSS